MKVCGRYHVYPDEQHTIRQGCPECKRQSRRNLDQARRKGLIPTARVRAVLLEHVAEYGVKTTAELADMNPRQLYQIVHVRQRYVRADTVDRILTRLGMVDVWHLPARLGGLADWYDACKVNDSAGAPVGDLHQPLASARRTSSSTVTAGRILRGEGRSNEGSK